ncbi:phage antirepressor N-terminal domain-containing protein [Stutzerimonas urumqiensis]|uniref:phage antirepressor N-terminal domain-containing protein n=1 Tax=Stutzerimonas urumqiensis TaxID=638269 RepID=UPI000EADA1D7|nr:phage antirepressor N-terminal domain-containing protein [Stutzerimonas urumqiensis]
MRTSKIKIQGLTIPYLIGSDSERYWPMRPICEAMGLNWHSQAAKMHPPRYSPREHDVSLPGQPLMKRALCLPQSEFEFWLKSLSSRKVSPVVRRHLDQLRTHFFGGTTTVEEQPPVPATAAASVVLNRILNWRAQQTAPSNRPELLKQIADQFREKNGFEIAAVQDHQLRASVASLSTIIYQHDRLKTPSQMPISQRVDAIIKSIVDARPQRIHLLDADFAALMCGVELEQQHHSSIAQQGKP